MVKRLFIGFVLTVVSLTGFGQDKEEVYAGIILHIMKYVEWPDYDEAKMEIGVVNNSELTKALNTASAGKKVHFKDVQVTRFVDIALVTDVHVLFIPKKQTTQVSDIVGKSEDDNILVITEDKSTSVSGASINFFEDAGSLKFEIYSSQLAECGLQVSEQLTKYAIVKD